MNTLIAMGRFQFWVSESIRGPFDVFVQFLGSLLAGGASLGEPSSLGPFGGPSGGRVHLGSPPWVFARFGLLLYMSHFVFSWRLSRAAALQVLVSWW